MRGNRPRLAIVTSHPIQYYAPYFRSLSGDFDITVYFAHKATPKQQATAGYGTPFDWDIDLTSGYQHVFLENVSRKPGTGHFRGCDTPGVERQLREGAFDALLLTGWNLKCYFQALLAAKRIGLPVMVRGDSQIRTPRSVLKRFIKALAYPRFLRSFDAGLFVGQRNKAYWRHYGYPADRLFHSPHCVDTDFFASRATQTTRATLRREFGLDDNTPVALFVGRLVAFKRPTDLVEAAAKVRATGCGLHLMIAGSGELEAYIRARAEAMGVPAHFLGFRNQSEMPSVYSAADVLVLPSESEETWGLVANEALASGCPVIVSEDCGCAPDIAEGGIVGRCFPTGDTVALAAALRDRFIRPPEPQAVARLSAAFGTRTAAAGTRRAFETLNLLST